MCILHFYAFVDIIHMLSNLCNADYENQHGTYAMPLCQTVINSWHIQTIQRKIDLNTRYDDDNINV